MTGDATTMVSDEEWIGRIEAATPSVRPTIATIVMIVDDDGWAHSIMDHLVGDDFEVTLDPLGSTAFDVRARHVDVVVIDWDLRGRSGEAICVAWRSRQVAPILAVAASDDERTVLAAFSAGADQFVSRDASAHVFVARLRSLLRRVPARHPGAEPGVRSVLFDDARRFVVVADTEIPLTEQEYDILELMVERAGRVVHRRDLNAVLSLGTSRTRTLDFLVRRLREKLEAVDDRRRISVVRGVGFRFDDSAVPPANDG